MNDLEKSPRRAKPPRPVAGGVLLLIAPVAGALIGVKLNEPSIGIVAGLAAGVVAIIALALWERRRNR